MRRGAKEGSAFNLLLSCEPERSRSLAGTLMPLLGPSLVARVLTKERDDAILRAAAADKVVAEAQQKLELAQSMEGRRETAHAEQLRRMQKEVASLQASVKVGNDRLKEAQSINKSLSALGDVIAALAEKAPHVPYRNSKLTYLLQNALGGDAKTLMFANVSPVAESAQETLCSLRFAAKVNACAVGGGNK